MNNNLTKSDISTTALDSFASCLLPEIKRFYNSAEGKEFYKEWSARHPEYFAGENGATKTV